MFLHSFRNTVRQLQNIIDPAGVEDRKAKRLKRRRYVTPVREMFYCELMDFF